MKSKCSVLALHELHGGFDTAQRKSMNPQTLNLLAQLPLPEADEHFQILLETPAVRIERIVSDEHSSAPGFWYDQAHDEWVMLLQGEAVLEFDGAERQLLRKGDSLLIPAHCRHRVGGTGPRTVWLAVHVLGGG
jgi:cupin 2 domain-containing protein